MLKHSLNFTRGLGGRAIYLLWLIKIVCVPHIYIALWLKSPVSRSYCGLCLFAIQLCHYQPLLKQFLPSLIKLYFILNVN